LLVVLASDDAEFVVQVVKGRDLRTRWRTRLRIISWQTSKR
jgi:hypothetical protein